MKNGRMFSPESELAAQDGAGFKKTTTTYADLGGTEGRTSSRASRRRREHGR